jgi:hypothetical protein
LDAVKRLFENNLLPFFKKFECHQFRKSKLWNEECDAVAKKYMKVLQELFRKYSGRYALAGQAK